MAFLISVLGYRPLSLTLQLRQCVRLGAALPVAFIVFGTLASCGARHRNQSPPIAFMWVSIPDEQASFESVPDRLPELLKQIAQRGHSFLPRPPVSDWLSAATRRRFVSSAIDDAARNTGPAPADLRVDTKQLLSRFALASNQNLGTFRSPEQNQKAMIEEVARQLPSVEAARQRGLSLDRINQLLGSTTMDSDLQLVRAYSDKEVEDGAIAIMASTRASMDHLDDLYGNNIRSEVKVEIERNAAALRTLSTTDVAALRRFYESPVGRTRAEWIKKVLVRAHDNAGAAVMRDFYGQIRHHPNVRIGEPS